MPEQDVSDKIRRMLFDDWRAFLQTILTLFHAQTKASAKF